MKKYLLILSAFALLGCVQKNVAKGDIMVLEDKEYKITKVLDKANNKEYKASGDWSIVIDKDKFGMFVGCNRIFGKLSQTNGKIIYINPASTKMLCLDDMMAVEDLISQNLTIMEVVKNGLENNNVKIFFKQD